MGFSIYFEEAIFDLELNHSNEIYGNRYKRKKRNGNMEGHTSLLLLFFYEFFHKGCNKTCTNWIYIVRRWLIEPRYGVYIQRIWSSDL